MLLNYRAPLIKSDQLTLPLLLGCKHYSTGLFGRRNCGLGCAVRRECLAAPRPGPGGAGRGRSLRHGRVSGQFGTDEQYA